MKGINSIINPNYGYLTQSYFRYMDSEKKAQQRRRNNSLIKQQNPSVEHKKTMTVEEILENITKNENLKVNRQKVLQKMENEFQKNDPSFKIQFYLNQNETPQQKSNFIRKSPKPRGSISPQESLLQNRYTILRKSRETSRKINNFLKLYSDYVADGDKLNKSQRFSSYDQSRNYQTKKTISKFDQNPQPFISETVPVLILAQKEEQYPAEEEKKPLQQIENPFNKLYEKYEDLIISDMSQYGQDMKDILNIHRNKLIEQRAQTSLSNRFKKHNKSYINHDLDLITYRLCYSQRKKRANSYKQDLSLKFSANSINATSSIIDQITDIKVDLKQQVKNLQRLKKQTRKSYENQQINYKKRNPQLINKEFDQMVIFI